MIHRQWIIRGSYNIKHRCFIFIDLEFGNCYQFFLHQCAYPWILWWLTTHESCAWLKIQSSYFCRTCWTKAAANRSWRLLFWFALKIGHVTIMRGWAKISWENATYAPSFVGLLRDHFVSLGTPPSFQWWYVTISCLY